MYTFLKIPFEQIRSSKEIGILLKGLVQVRDFYKLENQRVLLKLSVFCMNLRHKWIGRRLCRYFKQQFEELFWWLIEDLAKCQHSPRFCNGSNLNLKGTVSGIPPQPPQRDARKCKWKTMLHSKSLQRVKFHRKWSLIIGNCRMIAIIEDGISCLGNFSPCYNINAI